MPATKRFNQTMVSDVLIIGGGIAGLLAAIRARDFVDKVVLVDKGRVGRSGCSPFAAGIYAVCFPEDNLDVWVKEMVETGEYLNDQEWAKQLCENSYPVASLIDKWAEQMGSPVFVKDAGGQFIRKRSRGHIHTSHCVINSLPMMDVLRRKADAKGVKLIERVMVTELHECAAVGFDYIRGELYSFQARSAVLAAGGCGFKSVFMGHRNLTGDLQAAAYRAGLIFKNMEQFASNTCHRDYDTHGMNLFVNVGGKFVNGLGEEFMGKYNPQLGSRARQPDLVLAFCREVKEGRGPIYLDMRTASKEDRALCRQILPETFMAFDRAGIDPFLRPMPWVPAFYGTIGTSGGVNIDLFCRTNIEGVYATGDTSCLPANGVTAIGGNALGFAAVSGYLAGENAAKFAAQAEEIKTKEDEEEALNLLSPLFKPQGPGPDEIIQRIQKTLISVPVAYLKTSESLKRALDDLEKIKPMIGELKAQDLHELMKCKEAENMLVVAELYLRSSLFREESRGFHFREDFPVTDNQNWLKWVFIEKDKDAPKVWAEDIPTPYVKPEQKQEIPPGVRRE